MFILNTRNLISEGLNLDILDMILKSIGNYCLYFSIYFLFRILLIIRFFINLGNSN
jgi:hypothetical protein